MLSDGQVPLTHGYHEREVRNIKEALESVASKALQDLDITFSLEFLNQVHRMLLGNLEEILEEGVLIGELRRHRVTVGTYLGAPADQCESLLNDYCGWLNDDGEIPRGNDDYAVARQVIKALVAHVYFAWIHPYGDGNGRMARLIEFLILLRAGVPDIAAHLLSNFYNKTVDKYRHELQLSHGEQVDEDYPEDGQLSGFIEYALEGYRDELKRQCLEIYSHQTSVIWHDYIHTTFPKSLSKIEQRQKRLALELTDPRFQEGLAFRGIRGATPAVEATYMNKDRTLRRDLKKLVEMKLLTVSDEKYRPNMEILFTFFANARSFSE